MGQPTSSKAMAMPRWALLGLLVAAAASGVTVTRGGEDLGEGHPTETFGFAAKEGHVEKHHAEKKRSKPKHKHMGRRDSFGFGKASSSKHAAKHKVHKVKAKQTPEQKQQAALRADMKEIAAQKEKPIEQDKAEHEALLKDEQEMANKGKQEQKALGSELKSLNVEAKKVQKANEKRSKAAAKAAAQKAKAQHNIKPKKVMSSERVLKADLKKVEAKAAVTKTATTTALWDDLNRAQAAGTVPIKKYEMNPNP